MAQSIKTQVGDLTGFASTDDNALQDWCDAGAKEIINVLPPELKEKCMTETTLDNSSPTMDLDGVGKILYVSRLSADSGGYRVSCRKVPSMYAGLTSDSSSLLYFGTVADPVYWVQSTSDAAILNVYPSPEATQTARVYHIAYPAVNMASSEIGNFPDEAQYLVVLYASYKALQRKMNDKSSDLPTLTLPVAPAPPSAPSFTTPDVASITISNIGTPPSYTSPNVTGDATSLTSDSQAITSGQIGNDGEFLEFDMWFTALGEMIEDDEDIELASAQIEKINTYIQAYNIAMQDSLNTFNKEGAEYQAKLQEALQQAQINAQEAQNEANLKLQKETQDYSSQLSKFQAEVGKYSAELNSSVQNFTLNLQKHSTDYQWLQGQYMQLKADYQQGLQMLISGGLPQQQQERKGR